MNLAKCEDPVTQREPAEFGEVFKRNETSVKLLTTPSACRVSPERIKERVDKAKQENSERGATNSIFKLKSNYKT